jgi:hypothetical protein
VPLPANPSATELDDGVRGGHIEGLGSMESRHLAQAREHDARIGLVKREAGHHRGHRHRSRGAGVELVGERSALRVVGGKPHGDRP